ncbi:MAG: metallophosphoesterase [Thermoplasmata archaeon]
MKKELAVIITLSLLFFTFFSGCSEYPDLSLEVQGGIVLEESNDEVVIRSYSPDMEIHLEGFKGNILLTNCHGESEISGAAPSIQGTDITLKIDSEEKHKINVNAPEKADFNFALIGDTQGMDHIFEDAVKSMEDIEFLIHLGDITPSGKRDEFKRALNVMNSTKFPVYTTIGNHDIKFDGRKIYESNFAPPQYSFTYSDLNFIFLDTSELSIKQEQIDRMEGELIPGKKNIVVTHAPYYDPFGGSHTIDAPSKNMMEEFIGQNDIEAFTAGHIHAFHQDTSSNTKRLITGGGGGSLVEGEHHYVKANTDLSFTKVPIETEEQNIYEIHVSKGGQNKTYTYQSLLYSTDAQGFSSFQNQFGNKRGQGYYEGVKVSKLLEEVGGMKENDTLVVESIDGYEQKFGYLNIYPDEDYLDKQGELILALKYDNKTIDEWNDGPRLVTLPEDGYYNSDDCEETSYPGQGYNIYDSAGARWVKYVKTIEVVEGG